jgi:hypothetical protein
MRYFFWCVVLLFVAAGCSTTEPVQQEEPEPAEPVITETTVPSWYNPGIHSSSDSTALHGYSLASATDSSSAVELSSETALEYLRFEIDRTAEEVRKNLVDLSDAEGNFNSTEFIIQLRNVVSDLQLDAATITLEHETTDQGVHYSYAKASFLRTELPSIFENQFKDEAFLEKIGTVLK